jgi:hypothetical protein
MVLFEIFWAENTNFWAEKYLRSERAHTVHCTNLFLVFVIRETDHFEPKNVVMKSYALRSRGI